MKKSLFTILTVLSLAVATLSPMQSMARGRNGVETALQVVATVGAIALIAVAIDEMTECHAGEYCSYRDRNRCYYQEVHDTSVSTECRSRGYWGGYQCVTVQNRSTMYIKSCSGFHGYYAGQPAQYKHW